jgi:hypothetical protein
LLHYLITGTILEIRNGYWTWYVCFNFLYSFCLKHFSLEVELSEIRSKVYIGLRVEHALFLSDCNAIGIFSTCFRKIWNIKFRENPSSRSRVVPCGRTDGDGQTDVTKLIVAFRNFASARKNS